MTTREAPSISSGPSGAVANEWLTPLRFGAVLALLLLAAFPKVVLGWQSFVYKDYGVLAYPVIQYAHESFWHGEVPLWNPLSNCGAPFLAQWGTMALYPFSIVYLLFPLPWSLSLFCLGHLFLGGMGMYFLAQRWTGNRFAASVGGAAFVFNGITLSCLMWPNYTVALGWMPWVIGLTERAWSEGKRTIVKAALAGALQMLSGVPEIAGFTWLLVLGFWAGNWVREKPQRMGLVGRLTVVVVLVSGLMAVQLLPFFDLLDHSQRDRNFATGKWSLPGWGWANLLVPLFHCFETYQGPFVQQGQAFFSSCYLGVGLLALGLPGVLRAGHWRGWVLAFFVVFGLVAALGENGHLYRWMRASIPLLGVGRFPVKFMILAAFGMPLLGAFTMRWWTEQPDSEWRVGRKGFLAVGLILAGGIAGVLWFAFRYPFELDQWAATWHNAVWRGVFLAAMLGAVVLLPRQASERSRIGLGLILLSLLAFDAVSHTPKFNPTIGAAEFEPRLWQHSRSIAPPQLGESRVMISPKAEKLLLFSTETNLTRDFLAKRLALWSNLHLLDAIPKVNGSSTLQLREEKQVEDLLYRGTNQASAGLLDFLSVSQETAPTYAFEWASRTNYCAIITCGQQPRFATAEDTLKGLAATDFDPRKTVYLSPEARLLVGVTNQTESKILSTRFLAHRVEIEVEAKAPSLVVIAQSFYHCWQASIDGRPARLLRANAAFQAMEVPAGHSRVSLLYEDHRLVSGAIISGLTAMLCLIYWWRQRALTTRAQR